MISLRCADGVLYALVMLVPPAGVVGQQAGVVFVHSDCVVDQLAHDVSVSSVALGIGNDPYERGWRDRALSSARHHGTAPTVSSGNASIVASARDQAWR